MNTNKPYREWTLKSHYSYDYDDFKWCLEGPLVHKKSSAMPEEIVVIEHSALTDLKRENEKLKKLLETVDSDLCERIIDDCGFEPEKESFYDLCNLLHSLSEQNEITLKRIRQALSEVSEGKE